MAVGGTTTMRILERAPADRFVGVITGFHVVLAEKWLLPVPHLRTHWLLTARLTSHLLYYSSSYCSTTTYCNCSTVVGYTGVTRTRARKSSQRHGWLVACGWHGGALPVLRLLSTVVVPLLSLQLQYSPCTVLGVARYCTP